MPGSRLGHFKVSPLHIRSPPSPFSGWQADLQSPSGRLAPWVLKRQEYDVAVIYKSGQMHLDAGYLSRNPLPVDDDDSLLADTDTIADIQAYDVAVSQQEDPNLFRSQNI